MTAEKLFDSQIKRMSNYGYTGHVRHGERKENNYWQEKRSCGIEMESKKYVTPGER